MTLTLQTIRDHNPCESGWKTLNKALGNSGLGTEITIGDVIIANGLDDALWCLRCLPPRSRVRAIMPSVKRASVHADDKRVIACIVAIDQWLAGDDTVDLRARADATYVAARAAKTEAAEMAAWAAAAAARGAATAAAARAHWAAEAEGERKAQRADLLAMFPPVVLREGV